MIRHATTGYSVRAIHDKQIGEPVWFRREWMARLVTAYHLVMGAEYVVLRDHANETFIVGPMQ